MNIPTVTILGGADNGKSTLIGRLLMETFSVSPGIIEKTKAVCLKDGIDFEPAYLVDYIKEEREQKSTKEWALAELKLDSDKILIIDTPGQMALSKKMISGLTQADMTVLILDGTEENYEKYNYYFNLLSFLNVRDYVILINKVDLINYDEQKYVQYVSRLEKKFGLAKGAEIIPVSALKGDNVTERSENMPWFGGEILKSCLKNFIDKKQNSTSAVVLFPVQDIIQENGKMISLGKLAAGAIRSGDRIFLLNESKVEKTVCSKVYHLDKECKQLNVLENGAIETTDDIAERDSLFTDSPDNFDFKKEIKVRLYIMENLNLNDKNLSVRYLKFKAGIAKLTILTQDGQQPGKAEEDKPSICVNEFVNISMRLVKNIPLANKNIQEELPQAKQIVVENNRGDLVAAGIIFGKV